MTNDAISVCVKFGGICIGVRGGAFHLKIEIILNYKPFFVFFPFFEPSRNKYKLKIAASF